MSLLRLMTRGGRFVSFTRSSQYIGVLGGSVAGVCGAM